MEAYRQELRFCLLAEGSLAKVGWIHGCHAATVKGRSSAEGAMQDRCAQEMRGGWSVVNFIGDFPPHLRKYD